VPRENKTTDQKASKLHSVRQHTVTYNRHISIKLNQNLEYLIFFQYLFRKRQYFIKKLTQAQRLQGLYQVTKLQTRCNGTRLANKELSIVPKTELRRQSNHNSFPL
jgi:hypothetical protein